MPPGTSRIVLAALAGLIAPGAVACAQADVPPKQPRPAPAGLSEPHRPLVTRTWAAGERIASLDLALFDDNNDRRLDHRDTIYRKRLVVRTRGGRQLPGPPAIRLTARGPVFRSWFGPQPVTVWAHERFGLVDQR